MKKHGGTIARVAITLLGLWLAFRSLDFGDVAGKLAGARWGWVFWGFMLVNVSLVLRAYRWLVLLRGLGVEHISLGRLIELYFVGNFFNAFLPSGFGGDAVRVVEVAQEVPTDVAMGTVFLDRFTGLLVLFAMGLLALPLRPSSFPAAWAAGITLVCVAGILAGVVLLDGRLIRQFGGWLPARLSPVGHGFVARFLRAVQGCGWRAIWGALLISAAFDVLLVAWWTAATHALNHPVSFLYNLLVVPIFAVALLIPSIGGLGPSEALAIPLFAGAGLDSDTAVGVSLLVFIMLRLSGLLGLPFYLYTIWRTRRTVSAD